MWNTWRRSWFEKMPRVLGQSKFGATIPASAVYRIGTVAITDANPRNPTAAPIPRLIRNRWETRRSHRANSGSAITPGPGTPVTIRSVGAGSVAVAMPAVG